MTGSRNLWRFLGVALVAVGIVLALRPRISEFLVVDSCLDHGGSYDYATGSCDHAKNYPYVPWSARSHGDTPMLQGLAFVLGGALVFVLGGTRIGRHSS
jgi:drug/metabolite transporter (DMT)-like permease